MRYKMFLGVQYFIMAEAKQFTERDFWRDKTTKQQKRKKETKYKRKTKTSSASGLRIKYLK